MTDQQQAPVDQETATVELAPVALPEPANTPAAPTEPEPATPAPAPTPTWAALIAPIGAVLALAGIAMYEAAGAVGLAITAAGTIGAGLLLIRQRKNNRAAGSARGRAAGRATRTGGLGLGRHGLGRLGLGRRGKSAAGRHGSSGLGRRTRPHSRGRGTAATSGATKPRRSLAGLLSRRKAHGRTPSTGKASTDHHRRHRVPGRIRGLLGSRRTSGQSGPNNGKSSSNTKKHGGKKHQKNGSQKTTHGGKNNKTRDQQQSSDTGVFATVGAALADLGRHAKNEFKAGYQEKSAETQSDNNDNDQETPDSNQEEPTNADEQQEPTMHPVVNQASESLAQLGAHSFESLVEIKDFVEAIPEMLGTLAEAMNAVAQNLESDTPANAAVSDDIAQLAAQLHGLSSASQEISTILVTGNEADFDRIESPRPGEEMADYTRNAS